MANRVPLSGRDAAWIAGQPEDERDAALRVLLDDRYPPPPTPPAARAPWWRRLFHA